MCVLFVYMRMFVRAWSLSRGHHGILGIRAFPLRLRPSLFTRGSGGRGAAGWESSRSSLQLQVQASRGGRGFNLCFLHSLSVSKQSTKYNGTVCNNLKARRTSPVCGPVHGLRRAFSLPAPFRTLTVETPDTREDASDFSTSTSTQTTARKGPDRRSGARRADEHPYSSPRGHGPRRAHPGHESLLTPPPLGR